MQWGNFGNNGLPIRVFPWVIYVIKKLVFRVAILGGLLWSQSKNTFFSQKSEQRDGLLCEWIWW